MNILLNFLLIIIGFVLVTVSADFLVDGASAIAKRLHVSDLVVGLTVVAFGTSAPELIVNIVAAIEGSSEIAITNIVGSNSINTFIVLGCAAIAYPLTTHRSTRRFDMPLCILASAMALLLSLDFFVRDIPTGLSRWDGLILLTVFALFMWHSLMNAREDTPVTNSDGSAVKDNTKIMAAWKAVLLVVCSLIGLVISGKLIVDNATSIARHWGVSDSIIGVTIVALGTSLPELATSVVAAAKKNVDLAVGNVIGSNIFNVFCILGISSIIRPLETYPNLLPDTSFALLGAALIFLFALGRRHSINRWQGALLLILYGLYLWWMIATI